MKKNNNLWTFFNYFFVALLVFMLIFYDKIDVATLFILLLAFWFGGICRKMAVKHKRNQIVAFLVGFLFGLFGLIGYWVYIQVSNKKKVR